MKLGQSVMGNFLGGKGLGNHADDLPTGPEGRVGNDTHQSNSAASINQSKAAPRDRDTNLSRCLKMGRRVPRRRTAEDADGGAIGHENP
jgi:hypothetical protein